MYFLYHLVVKLMELFIIMVRSSKKTKTVSSDLDFRINTKSKWYSFIAFLILIFLPDIFCQKFA
jgi:hypothetical protein